MFDDNQQQLISNVHQPIDKPIDISPPMVDNTSPEVETLKDKVRDLEENLDAMQEYVRRVNALQLYTAQRSPNFLSSRRPYSAIMRIGFLFAGVYFGTVVGFLLLCTIALTIEPDLIDRVLLPFAGIVVSPLTAITFGVIFVVVFAEAFRSHR